MVGTVATDDDDFAQGSYKLTVLNPDGSKPAGNEDNTGTVLAGVGIVVLVLACAFGVWFLKRRKPAEV